MKRQLYWMLLIPAQLIAVSTFPITLAVGQTVPNILIIYVDDH